MKRLFVGFLVVGTLVAALAVRAAPQIFEAEKTPGADAQAVRDTTASGGEAAVAQHGQVLAAKPSLPAGQYRITAYVLAHPVEVLHRLSLVFQAGPRQLTAQSAWFDTVGTYVPMTLYLAHPGGPLPMSLGFVATSGFDGMRKASSDEEAKQFAQVKEDFEKGKKVDLPGVDAEPAKEKDEASITNELEDAKDIKGFGPDVIYVGCDRVEAERLGDLPAMVRALRVDKVHYLPGEEVKGEADVAAVATPGEYKLIICELRELADAKPVFEKAVTLTTDAQTVAFSYKLDTTEFGRELVAVLAKPGAAAPPPTMLADSARQLPGSASEVFGVSQNVYRIGITGSAVGHDRSRLTQEQAAATMRANKASYANYFEVFAWGPCDYSNLAPETEFFWSGQTQYPGSRAGFKHLLGEAHKVGVKGITYGKACAGGIEGFKTFQRHPDYIGTSPQSGISTEAMGTFLLEVMLNNEYGGWQDWQSLWCNWETNDATVDFGADAIIASAKEYGWDGVRWDGHFTGKMARFKQRMNAAVPGFVHGYNIAFANPGSEIFLPSKPVDDFHECAKDHGLMMDESAREYSHTNYSYGRPEIFYQAICREGDYMKRIGGLPLFITFDMASQLDATYNVIMGLAAGQRYTYMTSPGDFPAGQLTRWLTRWSAFVWDDTKRIGNAAEAVTVQAAPLAGVTVAAGAKEPYPLLWQESCWIRDVAPGHKQLLVNIVNPPRYPAFANRVQPPSRKRTDVRIAVKVPAGTKLTALAHLSPDVATGMEPLTGKTDAGNCAVTVPQVGVWSIVVFDVIPAAGTTFAAEPFPLTAPIEDAAAYMKKQEGEAQAKATAAAAQKAGIAAPTPAPERDRRWTDYKLAKNFDAEDEAKPEITKLLDTVMKRQEQKEIIRDGILDVHHCRGIFSWLNQVQAAIAVCGAGRQTVSWMDRHYGRQVGQPRMTIDEFPDSYPALYASDVLIMDNLHAEDVSLLRRIMIKDYVAAGGGLLVFGGHFNLSCGTDQSTWTEAIMPVRIAGYRQFAIDEKAGFKLAPVAADFFPARIDWSQAPSAFFVDTSPLKDGAKVLLTAGGKPAIVSGTYGKGRVIVVMMNQHGAPAAGLRPYWEWRDWPQVVGSCLRWLAEGCATKNNAGVKVRKKDPNAMAPDALRIEAEVQTPEELAKNIRSALRNVVDQDSARDLLECTVDHVGRLKDIDLLQDVLTSIEPFLDASFQPLVAKLADQDLAPLKVAACRIIGYSKDTGSLPLVKKALAHEDPAVRRAALFALGELGGPDAIALLHRHGEPVLDGGRAPAAALKEAEYRFYALTRLVKLQVPGAVREALPVYGRQVRLIRALKAIHFSMNDNLYGGVSFKLTPEARRRLTNQYERFKVLENVERRDTSDFEILLQTLTPAQVQEAFDVLEATDSLNLVPTAYSLFGRLPPADAKTFAPKLKAAKLPELRMLVD